VICHLLIIYVIYCHFQAVFSGIEKGFQWFAVTAKNSGPKTISPAEPPVDDLLQPGWRGKVKAGTRPAQPVGVGAFTFPSQSVSYSIDGRCSGERIYGRDFKQLPLW